MVPRRMIFVTSGSEDICLLIDNLPARRDFRLLLLLYFEGVLLVGGNYSKKEKES